MLFYVEIDHLENGRSVLYGHEPFEAESMVDAIRKVAERIERDSGYPVLPTPDMNFTVKIGRKF